MRPFGRSAGSGHQRLSWRDSALARSEIGYAINCPGTDWTARRAGGRLPVAGLLLLLACGFACAGFLLVALFSMGMWLFTHDAHAFWMMLGYFAYAGGAFAAIAALSYCHGKFADGVKAKRDQQIALHRIGECRLMRDATFEPAQRSAR
jgi:hypothetical protein